MRYKYAYINIVIIAAIALVYFLSTSDKANSVMAQTASNPIYRAATSKESLALVSWYDSEPALLESYAQTADAVGIKLNVFVPSQWLLEHRDSLGYTLQNGHIAGMYGNDIPKDTPPDEIEDMLRQGRDEFANYMEDISLYMPNSGEFTKRLSNCAGRVGLNVVLWSKDSRAYVCTSAEEFAAEVVKNADYGDFILVRLDERFNQALPILAGKLAEKGLSCVGVKDLLYA